MPKLTIKKVFSTCHEKFCIINGAPIRRLIDKIMCKERSMLTKIETKSKVPFGHCNGRPDKSDGSDPQFAELKKALTLAQREISNFKNQLHHAKENIAKERAGRSSKSKNDQSLRRKLGARESGNKLSGPRQRNRKLHHRVRH